MYYYILPHLITYLLFNLTNTFIKHQLHRKKAWASKLHAALYKFCSTLINFILKVLTLILLHWERIKKTRLFQNNCLKRRIRRIYFGKRNSIYFKNSWKEFQDFNYTNSFLIEFRKGVVKHEILKQSLFFQWCY